MAFLFIVWIPTGKYEECQKNNRIWGFEEIDINKISSDSEDDDLKVSNRVVLVCYWILQFYEFIKEIQANIFSRHICNKY